MTTQEKVQHIRKACIEANDNITLCIQESCLKMMCNEVSHQREIRLADILLAIGKQYPHKFYVSSHGEMMKQRISGGDIDYYGDWNLSNDSLSYHAEHIPEVIDFIYSILS